MSLTSDSRLLTRSEKSEGSSAPTVVTITILFFWLAAVVFTVSRHEFWRDEVRALSLVRAAGSPLDLYALIQYDGHPALWYLLLYIGTSIIDSPLVLPVTSVAVAFAAVALFMFSAPFPYWMRSLFIFSALPFYEYSVMARNYGISMLLLFLAAVAYRSRAERPLRLAVVLALLANTNAHSTILACIVAALWAWDSPGGSGLALTVFARPGPCRRGQVLQNAPLQDLTPATVETRRGMVRPRARALFLAAVIIFAGVLVAAALAMPRENTILQSVHRPSARELGRAFLSALVRPDETFSHLLPGVVPSAVAAALLTLASIGLVNRPNLFLAALEAQIAFGIFFRVVYPGAYRHEGLFLMFLVFLYWIFLESRDAQARLVSLRHRPLLFRAGLSIALLALILANLARSRIVWADVRLERSSSKALAAFLSQSNEYSTAIIVPEPDFLLESLPYYASNPIYLPRERRFGKTVSWTTESQPRLSLSEVLKSAYEIRTRYGRPVLIALGWWDVESSPPGEKKYILGKVFSWSDDELAAFRRSTVFVAEFNAPLGDESYKVYALAK